MVSAGLQQNEPHPISSIILQRLSKPRDGEYMCLKIVVVFCDTLLCLCCKSSPWNKTRVRMNGFTVQPKRWQVACVHVWNRYVKGFLPPGHGSRHELNHCWNGLLVFTLVPVKLPVIWLDVLFVGSNGASQSRQLAFFWVCLGFFLLEAKMKTGF